MVSIIDNKYFKLVLGLVFLGFILFLSGMDYMKLLDLPTLIFLFCGTGILTIIRYKKGMPGQAVLKRVKQSSIITGVIGLFIGFMALLTSNMPSELIAGAIAVNLLMVPYTALLYFGIVMYESKLFKSEAAACKESVLQGKEAAGGLTELSERERDIVQNILAGRSNKEIAEKLFISENTVKKHTSSIFKKLEVKSRYELICKMNGSAE